MNASEFVVCGSPDCAELIGPDHAKVIVGEHNDEWHEECAEPLVQCPECRRYFEEGELVEINDDGDEACRECEENIR